MNTKYDERWGKANFAVADPGQEKRIILLSGRTRWALECLVSAGRNGCTPIDTPGPRWSDYVFKLRKAGVNVETITEGHDGPFRGTHARYVLRSRVALLSKEVAA